MRILQICNQPPYPPMEGGSMAANFITQGLLKNGCEVKVLAMSSFKKNIHKEDLPADYVAKTGYESVFIDLRVRFFPAFINFLKGKSYHIARFISEDFKQTLIRILQTETFDVIHLEGLYLSPYVDVIRKYSEAKIVMRSHNVEHIIWEQIAELTGNGIKRFYLKHLAKTMKKYELSHQNSYDGMVCITQSNMEYFREQGCRIPLTSIPFGIEMPDTVDDVHEEPNSLFHIGSMNWMPNAEGIRWFLENTWEELHKQLPDVKLYLAGRHMPAWLRNSSYPNVIVEGEVADAMQFVCSKSIMIVPLLSGSGIRVKIIEAMSAGKAVVTTKIGAEGIEYTDNENILIANTPNEFITQIQRLVNDKDLCSSVGENAKNLIFNEYNTSKLIGQLLDFYNSLPCFKTESK